MITLMDDGLDGHRPMSVDAGSPPGRLEELDQFLSDIHILKLPGWHVSWATLIYIWIAYPAFSLCPLCSARRTRATITR